MTCCASPTASARRSARRTRTSSSSPRSRRSSASTRAASSSTRTTSPGALEHAVRHDLDGVFNCAADGVLALSEVISLLGKINLPVIPPVGTSLAAAPAAQRRRALRARDAAAVAIRARSGQPQVQGDGLPLPLHHARGRPEVPRAPAAGADPRGVLGALPLRAGGRGVPAPQPERPAGVGAARQTRCTTSRRPPTVAEAWRTNAPEVFATVTLLHLSGFRITSDYATDSPDHALQVCPGSGSSRIF